MFFLRNMVIEITSIGLKRSDSSRVISLSYIKCDKLVFVVLLTVFWSINNGNSLDHQDHNGKQHSYSGQFVGEEEAEAIAIEENVRLAKIPCNFSTKTNCIYAEQEKLSLPVRNFLQRSQQIADEIVVSWVQHAGVINTTKISFQAHRNRSSSSNTRSINNISGKPQNDFYNFNWIFELLACMMLASAFEICLLVLRNLRNISLAFFGFWSALNLSLQNLYNGCSATTSSPKSEQQRNVTIGEKRTLSYIFAILTWRASQTAKGGAAITEENLRDESNQNPVSYGHVTSMGDLLLLILFTHVYYQRQRFHQSVENEVNVDPEHLLKVNKDNDQNGTAYKKFYDIKQNNNCDSNAFKEQTSPSHRRASNKSCSHFCGNMYQQISSSLQERKTCETKLANLATWATKLPYLTYCTDFVWCTCCFCQYSCRSCCCCCSNYRRWSHRCYIYIPLCNTIYCCCFHKSLKSFHNANYQYCCYLCCWQDVCYINILSSHATYHCCHCHFYCCLCNTSANKTPVRTINLLLLNKTKNSPLSNGYQVWKLMWNNQNYTILYQIGGQTYSLIYVTDANTMFLYKRNYYQSAVDVLSCLLPQYLSTIKNFQTFLKWKRLHVAVVVMALIVICASSGGAAKYNQHHFYSSLLNRCSKHFSKCRQNKKRRKRRRRRHQHCKAYRPQHYFYTTFIQCVKKQKTKKLPKNLINKLHKKLAKVITPTTPNYEHSLAAVTAMSPKAPMVRAIRRVRSSKPNIVWLLIGLIWFEGPKIVNCNVIINYQNQQQPEQQQQQQHQQQAGNTHKETTTNSVNSNFEYKIENFNQMKTKNSNNNSSNNNNSNKNKNKNNNNNSSNSTNNSNRSSTTSNNNSSSSSSNNIHLSVNVLPIINTIHLKHYCNSNYHHKLIRSSQRVQRALKSNSNLDTSITSSASLNYNNLNDDLSSEQMPSSAFQAMNEESHAQSDLMRLESIKHQILYKLGLTRKPNVSHPLPKQFIWDTIYRADGIKSFHEFSNTNNFQDHQRITPEQSYPYWPRTPPKSSTVVPANIYQQRQQRQEDRSEDNNDSVDSADNIKRSLGNINVIRKKYGKNRQQQQEQQTHSKHYNNDIMYRKRATATSTTKNLNELLYTTTNRNKLIKYTNKTVNNFTILKHSKHQKFYKNSPHSTTTTSAKKPITHQQQINQHTNNNNKNSIRHNSNSNNNSNNNNNNVNNSNNKNSNSNNNIIMVQKHLRNNNKYIEEENKFTYLTDINSSDGSLNIVEEHKSPDSDENNSILRKKTHHRHNHDRIHVQPLQLQQNHDKTSEYYQHLNIDGIIDAGANANVEGKILDDDEVDSDNDDNEGDQYYRHNKEHQYRHDNYFSKLDTFDENEDFFGSTQEIITFAEKGKMYKNHRLVEFSHQNNEKTKQMLHVRYAEIHIRIDKISLKNKSRAGSGIKRKRLKIWIFQLIENNYTYKGFDHVAQFCASFEVDTSRLGWKKFDITTTVKEWYSRREGEKLRLLIDCTGCGKMYSVHLFNREFPVRERRIAEERRNANMNDINSKNFYNVTHNNGNFTKLPYNQTLVMTERDNNERGNRKIVDSKDDEDLLNSSRPFLVLHTEARRQRRVRRRAINCNGALHGQCCKESFYVSFKALGWDDWIIAPRGYFANYCRGDCTGPYRTPDTFQTFHAHFIEEYRKMGLLNGMQPCCAPIKFSSMSLIYYGDEGIIKRDLPKMVVDECGCP